MLDPWPRAGLVMAVSLNTAAIEFLLGRGWGPAGGGYPAGQSCSKFRALAPVTRGLRTSHGRRAGKFPRPAATG